MKKSVFLIVLLISFGTYAQKEVFRIDSIPVEGILLDKCWKFHAGDNPDFAKPDFDDSKWESIDPTVDVVNQKAFKKRHLGWFRLKFKVDSSLFGQTYAVSIRQVGSSKIYMNGIQITQFGEFSSQSKKSEAFDPAGNIFKITFGNKSVQNISVKFEKPKIFLTRYIAYENNGLVLQIVDIENADSLRNSDTRHSLIGFALDYFKAGLFLLIAFLHFWLYLTDKKNLPNLIFGILAFLFVFSFLLANYIYQPIKISNRSIASSILSVLISTVPTLFTFALYRTYRLKLDKYFYSLSLFCILSIFCNFLFYDFGWILGMIILNFLASFLNIKISRQAQKKGDIPAKAIANGELTYALCSTFVFFVSERVFDLLKITNLKDFIYNFGMLMSPMSVVYYFAYHFNQNRKNLGNKLIEVQTLSLEKQETLQKQNAELQAALLQGQTIERKRVAADLHDNLGSTLSALWLSVDAIDKSKMNEAETAIHQNLRENLEKAYNDVRLLSHNLLPEEFEKQGLVPALQSFVRKISKNSKIKFDLQIADGFGRVENKIEFELYSICLELINNIIKHSKATEAKIRLSKNTPPSGAGGLIELIISDNGIGTFNNDSDGKGTKNVQARVESLAGQWQFKNMANEGFVNTIKVPI